MLRLLRLCCRLRVFRQKTPISASAQMKYYSVRKFARYLLSGVLGLTHTVRLFVNMTIPGLAPFGFFTKRTGT